MTYDADDELLSVERAGYVNAHTRDDGSVYRFAASEAEPLMAAWTAGRAFYSGAGPDGETVTLKLASVEAIIVWTPAACISAQATNAESRARDRQRKLVEGES